jgi:hypothetical protein
MYLIMLTVTDDDDDDDVDVIDDTGCNILAYDINGTAPLRTNGVPDANAEGVNVDDDDDGVRVSSVDSLDSGGGNSPGAP